MIGIPKTWKLIVAISFILLFIENQWLSASSDGLSYETRAVTDSQKNCVNVNGTYTMYGQALSGMPQYYRFGSIPLTFDVMFGQNLSDSEKNSVTQVQLVQNDANIKIIFWSHSRLVKSVEIKSPNSYITCNNQWITLQSIIQGQGEAASGVINIIVKASLTDNGALQITQILSGRARSFFIPYSFKEEYGALFSKK